MGIPKPSSDRPIDTLDQPFQPPPESVSSPQMIGINEYVAFRFLRDSDRINIEYELHCAERAADILARTDVRSYFETCLGPDTAVARNIVQGIRSGLAWRGHSERDWDPSIPSFFHDEPRHEDLYRVSFPLKDEDGVVIVSSCAAFNGPSVTVEYQPDHPGLSSPPSKSSDPVPSDHSTNQGWLRSVEIRITPDVDMTDSDLGNRIFETRKVPGRTVLDLSDTHAVRVKIVRAEQNEQKFSAEAEPSVSPITQTAAQI